VAKRTVRKLGTARRPSTPRSLSRPLETYRDFVITARRINGKQVAIAVDASPAGRLEEVVLVNFPEREAAELRNSFRARLDGSSVNGGRMLINVGEALAIGRRLADVLFARDVVALFAKSLAAVLERRAGLRIRLAMDPALMDLPWEYVCRPDRRQDGGVSDFLLIDPAISLVRQAADASIKFPPITGKQRLAFVGTLWEGKQDVWEVWKEFSLLNRALEPVAAYVKAKFTPASDPKEVYKNIREGAAIFHYAGHCDFDRTGKPFLVRELPTTRELGPADTLDLDELAERLGKSGTRLAVMSACNSGYSAAVKPLLNAGVPVVVGVNGAVASISTIEFCAKLYESLAVGLTLDEAVGRARMHVLEWGAKHELFDWGLFMVHMACPDAVLFNRGKTAALAGQQRTVRQAHAETIGSTLDLVRRMDGMNFGQIVSELAQRRVLILGRFTARRLAVLNAIKSALAAHANGYSPELFTYSKPTTHDLVEFILAVAGLSRFIVADLSEPRSVQAELEAIAPHFQSVPIVALINQTGKEYATYESVKRRVNVVKPTIRYRSVDDLIKKLNEQVVPLAEAKLAEVRPPM
jgi:hypothetical protein